MSTSISIFGGLAEIGSAYTTAFLVSEESDEFEEVKARGVALRYLVMRPLVRDITDWYNTRRALRDTSYGKDSTRCLDKTGLNGMSGRVVAQHTARHQRISGHSSGVH